MRADRDGTARRAEIVVAAARLFEERGFHGTSMDDIAAAVGIKKPTLYHHVSSKSQIVLWIHDELADDLLARLRDRMRRGTSPAETLLAVLVDILALLDTKPSHLRVYFEHHREMPPVEGEQSRRKRDEYFDCVCEVIERGVRAGQFDAPKPRLATLAFFGMCNWSYQWYRLGGEVSAHDVAIYFWRTFFSGIAPGGVPHISTSG